MLKRKFKNKTVLLFLLGLMNTIFSMVEEKNDRTIIEDYRVWNSFNDVKNFVNETPSFPKAFMEDDSIQSFLKITEIEENNPIPFTSTASILETFPHFLRKTSTISPNPTSNWEAIKGGKVVLLNDKIIADDFFKTYTDFNVLRDLLLDTTEILKNQFNNRQGVFNMSFTKAIPVDENTVIHSMGACHGGLHSLVEFLNSAFYSQDQVQESPYEENSFKLKEKYKNHHWVLGGNFTDCGRDSTESLRLLCEVFKNNPDNFHIIRGEHEASGMNDKCGFSEELIQKYGKKSIRDLRDVLNNFYCKLPLGIWFVYQNGSVIPYFSGCIDQNDTGIVNLLEYCLNNKKITYKICESRPILYSSNRPYPNPSETKNAYEKLSQTTILNFIKSIHVLSNNKLKIKQINCCFEGRLRNFTDSWNQSSMQIFLNNGGICDLWNNDISIISMLPPALSNSYGVPFYYKGQLFKIEVDFVDKRSLKLAYPGMVHHITGCTYIDQNNNELKYDYVELPNTYLSDDILDKHKTILSEILNKIDNIIKNENFDSDQRDNLKMMIKTAKEQQKRMNITDDNLLDDLRTKNPKIRYTKSLGEKEFCRILKLINSIYGNVGLLGNLKSDKAILVEQEAPNNLNKPDKNDKPNFKKTEKNPWFFQKYPHCTGFGVLSLGVLFYLLISKKYFKNQP